MILFNSTKDKIAFIKVWVGRGIYSYTSLITTNYIKIKALLLLWRENFQGLKN